MGTETEGRMSGSGGNIDQEDLLMDWILGKRGIKVSPGLWAQAHCSWTPIGVSFMELGKSEKNKSCGKIPAKEFYSGKLNGQCSTDVQGQMSDGKLVSQC